MLTARALLIVIVMLGASIWVGSLVCLALVSSVTRRVLDERSRVMLFRGVGRRYGVVGTGSLIVAMAAGLTLTWPPTEYSRDEVAVTLLSGALLAATTAGMLQARRMTVRRRHGLAAPHDPQVAGLIRRGSIAAGILRGLIGALTLGLLLLLASLLDR